MCMQEQRKYTHMLPMSLTRALWVHHPLSESVIFSPDCNSFGHLEWRFWVSHESNVSCMGCCNQAICQQLKIVYPWCWGSLLTVCTALGLKPASGCWGSLLTVCTTDLGFVYSNQPCPNQLIWLASRSIEMRWLLMCCFCKRVHTGVGWFSDFWVDL